MISAISKHIEKKEKCVAHLHVLAQTAVTKYPKLGGLNSRHFFLLVLEAVKSKIKVHARFVPS